MVLAACGLITAVVAWAAMRVAGLDGEVALARVPVGVTGEVFAAALLGGVLGALAAARR